MYIPIYVVGKYTKNERLVVYTGADYRPWRGAFDEG
jgi:hypothetical protein